MKVRFLAVFLLMLPKLLFAQNEIIEFNEVEFTYKFEQTDFDTTIRALNGVVINKRIGQIQFVIPFLPIDESFGFELASFLDNNSQAFLYGGLLDGSYEFDQNGNYVLTGRGIMRVDDSKVGRGYAAEILLTVIEDSYEVEIKAPIVLSDYGFNTDLIDHPSLKNEISILIKAKVN